MNNYGDLSMDIINASSIYDSSSKSMPFCFFIYALNNRDISHFVFIPFIDLIEINY